MKLQIFSTLCADVKDQWIFAKQECFFVFPESGGPDRTRTYDPRLIKAVL